MKKTKRLLAALISPLIFFSSIMALSSCSSEKIFGQLSSFDNCTLGYIEGHSVKNEVEQTGKIRNAKWKAYDNVAELGKALVNHEIDGIPAELPTASLIVNNASHLAIVNENITTKEYAYCYNKGTDPSIFEAFNKSMEEVEKEGLGEILKNKWVGNDILDQKMTPEEHTGKRTINYYYYESGAPLSYHLPNDPDAKLLGIDYDYLINVLNKFGFTYLNPIPRGNLSTVIKEVEESSYPPDTIVIGGGGIAINDYLKESVNFTNSYAVGGLRMVARAPSNQISSKDDINQPNKRIGILQGSIGQQIKEEQIQKASSQIYLSTADCAQALMSNKIDGYFIDEPKAVYASKKMPQITYIKDRYNNDKYGFIFREGDTAHKKEFDDFFIEFDKSGQLAALKDKYFGDGDVSQPIKKLTPVRAKGEGGTLTYATSTTGGEPFNFYQDGTIIGYEYELICEYCKYYGYELKISDGTGLSAITDVAQGKADIGGGAISITDEREKSVDFSEPTYYGGMVIVVRNHYYTASKGFFERIADAFYSTFVAEGRWKMFLAGIGNTLLITVVSIVAGLLIGFGLFVLLRKTNNNKIFDKILKGATWLLTSMPVVVLLMIFYYLIFREAPVSGTFVSIIVFTLLFTCSTLSLLRLGTNAVDKGQEEAATALGYSKMGAFFKIILPQAAKHALPPLKGEISSLIKATSIVGYIAVQDLTKIADIIRSQTYEAFFPLIVVALVYILFAVLFTFIVNKINITIDPKRRKKKKILKGIKEHD
ncbi:MAG: transporter substrate-binding domain-containing protein [Bacilli bacterium]|nr:transporter substrate-binding domain-containing protein [Bacilli bacterium]